MIRREFMKRVAAALAAFGLADIDFGDHEPLYSAENAGYSSKWAIIERDEAGVEIRREEGEYPITVEGYDFDGRGWVEFEQPVSLACGDTLEVTYHESMAAA